MTDSAQLPWPPGASTGIGSMPGEDPCATLRLVLDECPDLPFLPELPARGPGSGLVGRGAALLAGLAVDLQPSGWRLVDRPGRDLRRARELLSRDLDVLEEVAGDYTGPLKVQAAGPWTLAATVELNRGDKALADPGATRDLGESLAEGLRLHVADLRRRVPGATVLLQLDEPALPVVLLGRVPTASGFGALPAAEERMAEAVVAHVIASAGAIGVVHCCARGVPIGLLQRAGARAISLDTSFVSPADDDAFGEAVEAGVGLLLGLVPTAGRPSSGKSLSDPEATVAPVRSLWRRLGFAPDTLPGTVVVTPACGLAGATPAYARAALASCRAAAHVLAQDPEGPGGSRG